jgi:hypothetical protein
MKARDAVAPFVALAAPSHTGPDPEARSSAGRASVPEDFGLRLAVTNSYP